MARQGQRHRRVVPEHVVPNGFALDEVVQQRHVALTGSVSCGRPSGEMRDDDRNGPIDLYPEMWSDAFAKQWFLDEKDPMFSRASGQQVLRTLEYEVPTQMRETDDIGVERARSVVHAFPTPKKRARHPGSEHHRWMRSASAT